ncbi:pyridoxal-phosphate dependent enzyme [Jhaorihella thermophila]
MAAGSIVEVIGRTPAVWLDRMVAARGLEGRILAKLDYLNPGFSKKDRVALGIIEAAEAAGVLAQGAGGGGVDQRQHGNRAGHCLRREGVSVRGGHVAGQLARARADDGCAGGPRWC